MISIFVATLCQIIKDDKLLLQKKSQGLFGAGKWNGVGGKLKPNETPKDGIRREIYEETGITKDDIELGPVVWKGSFDFVRIGEPTRMYERFIVARTKRSEVKPVGLTDWECSVIKDMRWFSLDGIKNSSEVIYPVVLLQYLPDIIAGKYPEEPIEIDLGRQPE